MAAFAYENTSEGSLLRQFFADLVAYKIDFDRRFENDYPKDLLEDVIVVLQANQRNGRDRPRATRDFYAKVDDEDDEEDEEDNEEEDDHEDTEMDE